MLPSIYTFTDVRAWLCSWIAHQPDGGTRGYRTWLGEQLGIELPHVRLLLTGERRLQLEWIEPLSRIASLDAEGREYLRRLILLQRASPREAAELTRSVWEIYAAKQGVAPAEIARLLRADLPVGPVELALLPALPLLAELPGVDLDPEGLDAALILAPDPAALGRVLARWRAGETFGEPDGARFCAIPGPGPGHGLGAGVWEGCYGLARHSLIAIPAEERCYHALVWAVDQRAVQEADAALVRLGRAVRGIVRRHAERPVGRVMALLCATHRVNDVLRPPTHENRPPVDLAPSLLSAGEKTATEGEHSAIATPKPEPNPCLYRFLDFAHFARTWVDQRRNRGQVCSATFLSSRSGLSRTLCNDLCTGASLLRLEHIPGVLRAFQLTAQDTPYLEGLSRYALATDPLAKARERALLVRYAAERGIRTPQGEHFRFASHWAPQVIYELASLPAFRHQRSWIHYALQGRVHWEEAGEILETLAHLRLLDPTTGRPVAGAVIQGPRLEEATRLAGFRLHDSVLELLTHELLFPAPDRIARGWMLAIPEAALPQVQDKLSLFQLELRQIYEAASARPLDLDRVVITATQLFPLARLKRR